MSIRHPKNSAMHSLVTLKEKFVETSNFRLVVVQDLPRDVIELLGIYLDIQPSLLREYIADRAEYNTYDPWVDRPTFDII